MAVGAAAAAVAIAAVVMAAFASRFLMLDSRLSRRLWNFYLETVDFVG